MTTSADRVDGIARELEELPFDELTHTRRARRVAVVQRSRQVPAHQWRGVAVAVVTDECDGKFLKESTESALYMYMYTE